MLVYLSRLSSQRNQFFSMRTNIMIYISFLVWTLKFCNNLNNKKFTKVLLSRKLLKHIK